jgi:hypothetical protein
LNRAFPLENFKGKDHEVKTQNCSSRLTFFLDLTEDFKIGIELFAFDNNIVYVEKKFVVLLALLQILNLCAQ